MKKLFSLLLVLSLLLCGCGKASAPETVPATEVPVTEAPTTEPATEPTTEPTTVPTTEPPVFYHPLNGKQLDAPYTGRIVANTVANTSDDIPHVGVPQADILFEVYASYGVVRCLALYSDISEVEAMGSIRSSRPVFNDLAQHYDALLIHGGGSSAVMWEADNMGIDHLNVDSLYRYPQDPHQLTAYRTPNRVSPYNLYANGPGILKYAEFAGIDMTRPEDTTYGLNFAEDGTPNGESALEIHTWFGQYTKDTTMTYDETLGKYVWTQYWGQTMKDEITDEVEAFTNVLILRAANTGSSGVYQTVDFVTGGHGWFACGGKFIPVLWNCADDTSPIRLTTHEGEEVYLGAGNTYIGVIDMKNEVKIDGVVQQ